MKSSFGKLKSCFGAILLLLTASAGANWKAPREALVLRKVDGDFRIFDAAVGDVAMSARNRAPQAIAIRLSDEDVERLSTQFQLANLLYSKNLGLIEPLKGEKFRHAQFIDVHLLPMTERMGESGDSVVTYQYRQFPSPTSALTISISSRWQPGNLTPEHELFHTYQYAYTYFKNPWFLEGLARSVQGWFNPEKEQAQVKVQGQMLPSDIAALNALLHMSYTAAPFWTRLRWLCDPSCEVAPSQKIEITKKAACGAPFIKDVLEKFRVADQQAAIARGIKTNQWTEKEQRASENNSWMLGALSKAITHQCPVSSNSELMEFDRLLNGK